MRKYSVKELSALAGISVRTLHHYDKIGLLKPAVRTNKGYRQYDRAALLKLQQILFYKHLDFPLKDIKHILDDPDFDTLGALKAHNEALQKKSTQLRSLLETIDHTISDIVTNKNSMTDKDLYRGFPAEKVEAIREEVKPQIDQ